MYPNQHCLPCWFALLERVLGPQRKTVVEDSVKSVVSMLALALAAVLSIQPHRVWLTSPNNTKSKARN